MQYAVGKSPRDHRDRAARRNVRRPTFRRAFGYFGLSHGGACEQNVFRRQDMRGGRGEYSSVGGKPCHTASLRGGADDRASAMVRGGICWGGGNGGGIRGGGDNGVCGTEHIPRTSQGSAQAGAGKGGKGPRPHSGDALEYGGGQGVFGGKHSTRKEREKSARALRPAHEAPNTRRRGGCGVRADISGGIRPRAGVGRFRDFFGHDELRHADGGASARQSDTVAVCGAVVAVSAVLCGGGFGGADNGDRAPAA
ncbi:unknown [Eubacterium sp. CAG:786]|nr:unknown [Eubacterium sp. CAG:786]